VIQRRATEVLKAAGCRDLPIDVFLVAEHLGAEVQPEFTDPDISGGLYRRSDGPVIGVNALHHSNRQRFTIAHEIGHLVLHREEDFFIDRDFRRDGTSGNAEDVLEVEANKFAACLLMPKQLVIDESEALVKPLRSEAVEALARDFKVSQQAMTFRLLNLGIDLEQS